MGIGRATELAGPLVFFETAENTSEGCDGCAAPAPDPDPDCAVTTAGVTPEGTGTAACAEPLAGRDRLLFPLLDVGLDGADAAEEFFSLSPALFARELPDECPENIRLNMVGDTLSFLLGGDLHNARTIETGGTTSRLPRP